MPLTPANGTDLWTDTHQRTIEADTGQHSFCPILFHSTGEGLDPKRQTFGQENGPMGRKMC